MKILIAVHHFPPVYTGGAEWEAFHSAAALQARGHTVKVVCIEKIDHGSEEGVSWVDDIYQGVSVRRLSFNSKLIPDPVRFEYDNPWIGEHFDKIFNEFQPDVFQLISGYLMTGRPIRVAHEHGIPTALSLEDFWFLCPRITMLRSDGKLSTLPIDPFTCARCLAEEKRRYKALGAVAPGLMKQYWHAEKSKAQGIRQRGEFLLETLNMVDTIIVRSNFVRSVYIQAGANERNIVFSRQGLDFPTIPSANLKKKSSKVIRVGYLGQITWHKGIHVLLEAVRQLPSLPMEVKIFGNKDSFPDYSAQLSRIMSGDPRISFAGIYHGHEEQMQVLENLDVVVVPSLWYENSPNIILESFANRTPVLASNLGGMAELVQSDKNGLTFETGNPADLARQLKRLSSEPGLLDSLRAGIGPVKQISQEIDELESTYQNLITKIPVH